MYFHKNSIPLKESFSYGIDNFINGIPDLSQTIHFPKNLITLGIEGLDKNKQDFFEHHKLPKNFKDKLIPLIKQVSKKINKSNFKLCDIDNYHMMLEYPSFKNQSYYKIGDTELVNKDINLKYKDQYYVYNYFTDLICLKTEKKMFALSAKIIPLAIQIEKDKLTEIIISFDQDYIYSIYIILSKHVIESDGVTRWENVKFYPRLLLNKNQINQEDFRK